MSGSNAAQSAERRRPVISYTSSELSQMILRIRATRASAVALLLLATISWGAIAEVTHHHEPSLSARQNGLSTLNVESSHAPASSNKSSSRDYCLICQLHQNLF